MFSIVLYCIVLLCRPAVRVYYDGHGVGRWSGDRVRTTWSDGQWSRRCRHHLLRDGVTGLRGPGQRRVDPARRQRCSDQSADTRGPVRTTAHPSRSNVTRLRSPADSRLQLQRAGQYVSMQYNINYA